MHASASIQQPTWNMVDERNELELTHYRKKLYIRGETTR